MNIKEIHMGLSGVIPQGAYENLRPSYDMTIEPEDGEDKEKIFADLSTFLHQLFDQEANRAKADLIEKQYANIRFYEKDGKKYPSVTSILDWEQEWRVTQDELRQYAARGTIIHAMIIEYLKTGKWPDPLKMASLKEEVSILMSGSLNMTWENCSHKAFMDKYGSKIKFEKAEQEVYNEENLYAGTYDLKGEYDGIRSIMDFKSGSVYDFRQLVAYAICEDKIEQLVILPIGPTQNKCGYMQPKICDTIQAEFREFLKARAKFKARFGI